MAPKEKSTYILAPTRDSPPDGPIAIGNVIASPKFPEERLNLDAPPPLEGANRVYESHKEGWRDHRMYGRSVGGGFFGEFLSLTGVGGELGGSRGHKQSTGLSARALDTYWFVPDAAYVRRSLQDPGVREFLEAGHSWRAQALYLVTGVMVARGAAETVSTLKDHGFHTQIGADLTPVGAPINVGPQIDVSNESEHTSGFDKASDFVLAYRLKWIKVKSDGSLKSGAYTKAANYSDMGGYRVGENGEMVAVEPIVAADPGVELEVEETDVDSAVLGSNAGMVFDDGDDAWECVALPP